MGEKCGPFLSIQILNSQSAERAARGTTVLLGHDGGQKGIGCRLLEGPASCVAVRELSPDGSDGPVHRLNRWSILQPLESSFSVRCGAVRTIFSFSAGRQASPNCLQEMKVSGGAGRERAVSTPSFATKYSFCSIFRDLQNKHTFAPLQIQNFS